MSISVDENNAALEQMRPRKAKGPDDVVADLWKLKCQESAELLFLIRVASGKDACELAEASKYYLGKEIRIRDIARILQTIKFP